MPFTRNDKTDEIDDQAKNDNEIKARSEAYYYASKPVGKLFEKFLISKGETFKFEKVHSTAAEVIIQLSETSKYHIYLDIVPKKYKLDLSMFENVPNAEQIKAQLGKLFLYSEMIFETLKLNIAKEYEDSLKMKLLVDPSNSTCYIEKDFRYRIGIKIEKVDEGHKSKNQSIAEKLKK